MRFSLDGSPFKNIHKYHDDDVLDYLDPHLREFAWHHHDQRKAAVPPCAFVLGVTQCSFVWGFAHPTPGAFVEQVRYEARHLEAKRVLLLAEVNSLTAPTEAALLAVEVQRPDAPTLRTAYDLLRPGRLAVEEDWSLHTEDEEPGLFVADPILQMVEEAAHTSRLVGVSHFFHPIFVNPTDSTGA